MAKRTKPSATINPAHILMLPLNSKERSEAFERLIKQILERLPEKPEKP